MTITIPIDRSNRHRNPSPIILALCFAFGLATALALLAPAKALPESSPARLPAQVRGEVLMLTSELIVVKSSDGTSILIPLEKETAIDSTVKVGDHVEVTSAPDKRFISIKRVTP
jgi:hypothetical protein